MTRCFFRCRFGAAVILYSLAFSSNAVDIDDIQTNIFNGSCAVSGCHNGSITPNLSAGVAFDNIVNVPSGNFGLDYIEPGDPEESYLLRKVDPSFGTISGGRMPQGRPNLSQSQIDMLSEWITDGAPEDDSMVAMDSDGDGVNDDMDAFPNDPDETTDSDGDMVGDNADAFPNDANETVDTDGDLIGDNADTDDDNDGLPDTFEDANGLDRLDANDADIDSDGDGISNLVEFQEGTNINDANDAGDACVLGDARDEGTSDLATEKRISIANPGSNINKQSLLRVMNNNDATTNVEIYGIDDNGSRSRKGPITFTLDPGASTLITAQDLENGRSTIDSNLCDGAGKWQLRVRSDNPVEVMGLIRTPDLFMTGLNDVAPDDAGDKLLWFGNPASNVNRATFLRIVSFSDVAGDVSITGIDDAGVDRGTVTFTLQPNESRQLTVQELEDGTTGLTGQLADGTGKWRFRVSSDLDIEAMSLIRTSDGFLSNLTGEVELTGSDRVIYYANPASETAQQTFIRVINDSDTEGTVTVSGIDDAGNVAPMGDVTFTLGAQASKQITIGELENGTNPDLSGMLGAGSGRWRLTFSAPTLDLHVQSLIRTASGFLTNLSRTVAEVNNEHRIWFFNPASNVNKVSSLRLVNNSDTQGSVTISGIDDSGMAGPNGDMTFNIAANSAMTITALDLEQGNSELGLVNPIGDGQGKWRLTITSDVDLKVQSLLSTPGFVSNLSRTVD